MFNAAKLKFDDIFKKLNPYDENNNINKDY